jgi:excisionase family DNA binding protein
MAAPKNSLSVTQAARLCGVGRTTVGYWIRSRKLRANRVGRNYAIPVDELLFYLKSTGQKIPSELARESMQGPLFRTIQNCWQYWAGTDHGGHCRDCIAFRNQLDLCFTVRHSEAFTCPEACDRCAYFQETYLSRIQFVHQIDVPAAVFRDLYLWGANARFAALCGVSETDLIGMGIERVVHPDSLALVIGSVKNRTMGTGEHARTCRISLGNGGTGRREVTVAVYPLEEPAKTYLVLVESETVA